MKKTSPVEALLWSIALPGFGQLLNRQYLKGVTLIILEFVINLGSNLNTIIMDSFQGDTLAAVRHTNYQWLLFYPCVYMFAIWDGFKDAGGGRTSPYAAFPFVFCAFFGTTGMFYSDRFRFMNILLGPVWLPMAAAFLGVGFGFLLKAMLDRRYNQRSEPIHRPPS
ncbi:hypothetical protein [Paenibacillus tarimensis]|uniref:hypothetical protein n=1 Tax=Paenibacillus tarimensis TaxID=416012 RepID=UPI001F2E5F27|nr:hypothetical protein [Paenibacillus tarimensis]MCF2944629.1 hypothetical protein [Paenibacillus tarimensis]